MSGIGMISRVRSVAMFMDALKNQTTSKLRQEPGISRSQNLATGMQFTNALTIAHVEYNATIPITVWQANRNRRLGKMRKY